MKGFSTQLRDHSYRRGSSVFTLYYLCINTPFYFSISQHHYSGSFCSGNEGLLQDLMTKATIRGNLTIFAPDAQTVRAKGLDYVLGETNSYSCHVCSTNSSLGCESHLESGRAGRQQHSRCCPMVIRLCFILVSFGSTLLLLTLLITTRTQIQSSRIFFHEGIGFKYNFVSLNATQHWESDWLTLSEQIQPVTLTRSTTDATPLPSPLPPHVQPQYYAAIIATEAIGSSGQARIVELVIDDPSIAGYAFYEGSRLARAVFINSRAFLNSSSSRTRTHLDLSFASGSATSATLKRLLIA